jgi:hypothetical protein
MVDNILVYCQGGRGDVLNAEPAIRYAIEKVFVASEKIAVITEMPELFEHLQSTQVSIHDKKSIKNLDAFLGYNVLCTFEHSKRPVHGLNQPLMHGVDFASLHMLGYLLPIRDRRCKTQPVSPEELQLISSAFTDLGLDPRETLLLHPGNTWETRTIPQEWWDAFLSHYQYPVCAFGSSSLRSIGDDGIFTGTTPLPDIPSLVDKLTIRGSIVAASLCWGLLTNDSFPVHVAGLFNNFLFTFSTTKHWESLKPYGHKRSYNFANEVFSPTWYTAVGHMHNFDKFPEESSKNLMDYLDPPEKVAEFIMQKFEAYV